MTASDHLSGDQFMPVHELVKRWDPNLKDPETLRNWSGHGYIDKLSADIKQNGMRNPVQINRSTGLIHDGHHRTISAMDNGDKRVPIKWVSGKAGEQ